MLLLGESSAFSFLASQSPGAQRWGPFYSWVSSTSSRRPSSAKRNRSYCSWPLFSTLACSRDPRMPEPHCCESSCACPLPAEPWDLPGRGLLLPHFLPSRCGFLCSSAHCPPVSSGWNPATLLQWKTAILEIMKSDIFAYKRKMLSYIWFFNCTRDVWTSLKWSFIYCREKSEPMTPWSSKLKPAPASLSCFSCYNCYCRCCYWGFLCFVSLCNSPH